MNLGTATPHIASHLIFEKDGKIAFVLRQNTRWMNNHYGLIGGKVEKDENYTAAAIHEALEEAGVTVAADDIEFAHVMHRRAELDWVDIYFRIKQWKGDLVNAEPHLHKEIAWLDLANLPDNVIPPVKYALEQIKAGKLYSEYGW